MSLTRVLNIGANGLAAAAQGTAMASHNVSNSATEGYTRRSVNLEPIRIDHGGGVRAASVNRVQDQFIERRSLGARSAAGESSARTQTLELLDSVFSEDAGGLGGAIDAFDAALSDLAINPDDTTARQVVLQNAERLTQAFSSVADQLSDARTAANQNISNAVAEVNRDINQIGPLNGLIVQGKLRGEDVGDLEDRRDQLIRNVSEKVPVTVIQHDTGAVSVLMAGSLSLVSADGSVHGLEATMEPTSGDVHVYRTTAGMRIDLTSQITTGSIGGTIGARDGALAAARAGVDQLAYDIATAYNAVHTAGYGLDGNTGRRLFDQPAVVAGAATNFAVSADVAGQPRFIAAASANTSLPGDNRNANAMLNLRDQLIASGGTATTNDALGALIGAAGSALQSARNQEDYAQGALSQLQALHDSVSGVSTDEEMISLMKFQRAYQASLRVIDTADQMLDELLNLRR